MKIDTSLPSLICFLLLFQIRRWQDEKNVTFHQIHKYSRIKELSFNASQKLSELKGVQYSQFHYLLELLRDSDSNMSTRRQCLAAIPATETWIFVDCSKELHNVTFLCE